MDDDTRALLARRHALAVGLACLGVAFLAIALILVIDKNGWGYDFEAYYQAAMRIARGDGLYLSFMLQAPFSPGPPGYYMYAPPLAVGVLPFTAVSIQAATVGWFVLRVLLLGVACAVMPVRSTVKLLVFAVAAFSHSVLVDLSLGNVSLLVVVALAFVWRGLDRPMGSIAAAVAMSVRPTMGVLLVWWAVRRRWRAVLWAIGAGIVLILITLPFVGIEAWQDFVTVLRNVSQVTGVPNNMDLATTLLRLNLDPMVATAALYAGYAVAIGATVLSLRHDRDLSFMVTISATMLLAPLLWNHYLASLLLPAAFLAQRGRIWGIALPLLGWLPAPLLPLVAIAGTMAPFLAERSDAQPAIERPWRLRRRRAMPGADSPGPASAPTPSPDAGSPGLGPGVQAPTLSPARPAPSGGPSGPASGQSTTAPPAPAGSSTTSSPS